MQYRPDSSPVLESLEARLAPAGVVMLTLANGVLNISGDSAANDLQITDAGAGDWMVTPLPGGTTQFSMNGSPLLPAVTFAAPQTVRASLGAGNDIMDMLSVHVNGALTINGNDGDDSFLISGVSVNGAVLINSGAGSDDIDLTSVSFAGTTTIKMGAGADYFTAGGDLFFHRGLKVDLGTGANTFDVNAVSLQSNAAISTVGSGSAVETQTFILAAGSGLIKGGVSLRTIGSSPTIVEIGAEPGDDLRVQGGFTVKTGAGDDRVDISRNLTVTGTLSLLLGNGFNDVVSEDLETLSVGHFRYAGGTGQDDVSIYGAEVTVAGNLTFSGGAGSNFLDVYQTTSLRIGGALAYVGGVHSDGLIVDGADAAIGGRLSFTGSHGSNILGFNAVLGSAGSLVYTGGSGSDVVDVGHVDGLSNLITIRGSVGINTGAGSSDVMVRNAFIYGNLNVSSNAGFGSIDTVQILESDVLTHTYLNLAGWAEADVVVRDSIFDGAFTVATGGGDDYVLLDTDTDISSIFSTFHGPVRIYLGSGNDIFAAGSTPAVDTVGGNFNDIVFLDGGSGYDRAFFVHPDYNNVFNGPQPFGRNMEEVN